MMTKITQNLHTHTTFCDGKNSAEEMAQAAVCAGLSSLGFSGHAYTPHDESYCMLLGNYEAYRDEIMRVKKLFSEKLDVFLGLEQDYYSVKPTIETDYLIGSVHYVEKNGEYIPVDETKAHIENGVNRLYGGDIYAFLEDYFELVSDVRSKTGCDIVGHIDLCEKFNEDGKLFDRTCERYVSAYTKAVGRLVSQGCIFEINTGAMSRGYTTFPYPHENILRLIAEMGGSIIFSSDTHSIDTVSYKLDEMSELAAKCGFTEYCVFDGKSFRKEKLI